MPSQLSLEKLGDRYLDEVADRPADIEERFGLIEDLVVALTGFLKVAWPLVRIQF